MWDSVSKWAFCGKIKVRSREFMEKIVKSNSIGGLRHRKHRAQEKFDYYSVYEQICKKLCQPF